MTIETDNYQYFVECYLRWAECEKPKSHDYFYKLAVATNDEAMLEEVASYRHYQWKNYVGARDMYIDHMKKKYGKDWKLVNI